MMLVYGTAGLAFSVLLFGVILIMCRNPKASFWATNFLVENIYTPTIVASMAISASFFIRFFIFMGDKPVSLIQLLFVIGIVTACIVLLKMLRIKKRLIEFEAVQTSAVIIKPGSFSRLENQTDEPPHGTTSGQKAA